MENGPGQALVFSKKVKLLRPVLVTSVKQPMPKSTTDNLAYRRSDRHAHVGAARRAQLARGG